MPIAITVLQGTRLDSSAVSLFDAMGNVPGVAITGAQNAAFQGGGAQLTIRGVTAGAPSLAGTSPIAYYLDGVPFGLVKSAVVPDLAPYDLDRVEVLRGPQGTLYGASARTASSVSSPTTPICSISTSRPAFRVGRLRTVEATTRPPSQLTCPSSMASLRSARLSARNL